jgi:hypothetical protein
MSRSRRVLTPIEVTANANHATVTYLGGFNFAEVAAVGAPAHLRLRHGSVAGAILAHISLTGDGMVIKVFEETFIDTPSGVYVEVVSGTIAGVLYNAS